MAEPEKDGPSLELPKLGLRRRKRPAPPPAPDPAVEPRGEPRVEPRVEHNAGHSAGHSADPPALETRPIVVEEASAPAPEPAPRAPRAVRAPRAPRPPRHRRERGPGGGGAAVLTGLVVGLGLCGLTWASLRSCERIQGTSSCGDVGYPMLGLILAAMVVVGWLLLRFLRVPDPGSTSFLGTGLAVVIALLVLVDHLLDRSMVVVVPLVFAATFALAHWVTRTFIEAPRD